MSIDTYKKEVELMNLEKLIEAREIFTLTPFPIPEKELLTRYEDLYTGAVNDVLREFCLLEQALPGHIVPLREYRTVAGLAFTVKSAPNVKISGEMTFRTQMLGELGEDAFIVWDTTQDAKATLWGGVMTATAKGLKVKAACIDGGIRDTHQILEADFPVFYKYRISNGSLGRCLITHYQIPIKIGDVDVQPGDVVLATSTAFSWCHGLSPTTSSCGPRRSRPTRKRSSAGSRKVRAFRRSPKRAAISKLP